MLNEDLTTKKPSNFEEKELDEFINK